MIDDRLTSDPGSLFQKLQERYGLGQDPLAMEHPFFPGAQRQHTLETLRHLSAFGDMALVVTGARGSGKTRLLAELVRGESERLDFQRLEVADCHSEQALCDRLLRIAHHGLGAGRSPRDAIFGFFRWSETATSRGRRIVLLIDDADHMPTALIQLLLTAYCRGDRSQGALPVLAGAESLVTDLAEASGLESYVHPLRLRPLNREELADYLRPRLQKAGGDTADLLSGTRLKKLHELSQGSFGRLKRTAPAVWLDMAGHQPAAVARRRSFNVRSLLIPLALVVLLGVSWLVVSWQYDATVASQETASEPPAERKTVRLGPGAEEWAEAADHPADADAAESGAAGTMARANPEAPGTSAADAGADGESATPVPVESDDDVQRASPVDESAVSSEGAATDVAEDASALSGAAPGAADDEAAVGEPSETLSETVPTQGPSGPDAEEEDAVTPEASRPAEAPPADGAQSNDLSQPAEEAPAFQPDLPQRFRDVAPLRTESGVTAQFIAGFEEATAIDFLNQHPDVTELVYTRSTRQGKPWYVVIYGRFPSREEARAAIARLPGNLARHDVWIRSLSGL
ncbi:AAA family ATPase [Marinobacter sp. JSM 1782161]|uniref:AAA family ATPase n=1 Tax=Marinobacter sp. JSM 1782161 TaxID=2685906 RepID=UPI001401CCD0|nr:AAA family ATPase [Marinobacter sp. JSM 1782161]